MLANKRIVVTRANPGLLGEQLAALGAVVVEAPLTRIEPLDPAPLLAAIARLGEYDWAVFTSRNGVEIFCDALAAAGRGTSALDGVKIASVGPATLDALTDNGVAVTLVPHRFLAEGLLDAMRERDDVGGARVLYPAAEGGRDVLPQGLSELGATVDRIAIYRSAPDPDAAAALARRIAHGEVDLVTLTAGSAAKALVDALGAERSRGLAVASIGPATSDAARQLGLDVVVEAKESTLAGLVAAIAEHYARE